MLTANVVLTYSANEVCGSIRASSRMPITVNSGSRAEACQVPPVEGAVVFFTGGTFGKVSAAITVHTAQSAAALRLIQKNVAWSRIKPPTTAPSSEPTLVEICSSANSRARRDGTSILTPYAWAGAM